MSIFVVQSRRILINTSLFFVYLFKNAIIYYFRYSKIPYAKIELYKKIKPYVS